MDRTKFCERLLEARRRAGLPPPSWRVPESFDVFAEEGDDEDAPPVDPAMVRMTRLPTADIGDYNELGPEDLRTVNHFRRQFRAGTPVRPPTWTITYPVHNPPTDVHVDGAHRAEAARRECVVEAPVAVVFISRPTTDGAGDIRDPAEEIAPPPDWETIVRAAHRGILDAAAEYDRRIERMIADGRATPRG